MNENVLTVIRAFGSEKRACDVGDGKQVPTVPSPRTLRYGVSKPPKKVVIEKVAGVSTSPEVVDVDVERIDRATISEINAALETFPEPTEKRAGRPLAAILKQLIGSKSLIGQTTAGIGRPIARRIGAMGKLPTFDPAMLMGKSMPRRIAGGAKGSIQNLLKSIGEGAAGIGAGAAGTTGKASLLGAGALGAGGLGISGLSGGPADKPKPAETAKPQADETVKPKKDEKKDKKKPAEKEASTSAQDTKKKDEGDKAKPGTVLRESSSDTPPKKAPEKKPEVKSENAVEYDEKTAVLRAAISPATLVHFSKRAVGEGDIPLLGPLGGKVLGGLGSAAGAVGLSGPGAKLDEWSKSPTGRNIAGGSTALLAAILAALAGKKMLGGRQGAQEDLELVPEDKMASFGVMLKASLASMGQSAAPLKPLNEFPERTGNKTTRRQAVFDDVASWSLGARL